MGYTPKNTIEKILFMLAGVKKVGSPTIPASELNAVVNYWLTCSITSATISTILLTVAAMLFVETKHWYIYIWPAIGAIFFYLRNHVYTKCASETLSLWK